MSAARQKTKGIKWFLALMALLGLAMLAIPFLLRPPAYLTLNLSDSVFDDTDFSGLTVEISNHDSGVSHSAPIRNIAGNYIAKVGQIKSGKTNWRAKIKGYYPKDFDVDIPPMERQTVPVSLKPTFGRLKIIPKNGVNPNEPIDATLDMKVNGKQVSYPPGKTIIISHLTPGKYNIEALAKGFYPSKDNKAEVTAAKTTDAPVVLVPKLKDHEAARIVLRWDKNPRDLDSHLFLPDVKGLKNRHIYFPNSRKKSWFNNSVAAQLDVDDTTSYGPETVTIYKQVNGLYHYAIYLFRGTGSIGGTSKAQIELFTHGGVKKFTPPRDCTKRWWHVMDLRIDGDRVETQFKNKCKKAMGWRTGKKVER